MTVPKRFGVDVTLKKMAEVVAEAIKEKLVPVVTLMVWPEPPTRSAVRLTRLASESAKETT